jgi:hypothetical protein
MLEIGMALWTVALLVSLLVPTLHQAEKHWWPWACVSGIVGGGLALLYIRRGRGNASGAHLPARSRRPVQRPPESL